MSDVSRRPRPRHAIFGFFTAGQAARMQDQWLFYRADGATTSGN
jgi:hypothetical protein